MSSDEVAVGRRCIALLLIEVLRALIAMLAPNAPRFFCSVSSTPFWGVSEQEALWSYANLRALVCPGPADGPGRLCKHETADPKVATALPQPTEAGGVSADAYRARYLRSVAGHQFRRAKLVPSRLEMPAEGQRCPSAAKSLLAGAATDEPAPSPSAAVVARRASREAKSIKGEE
eukprot:scaffold2296_cov88-Phaeocystis_antarctica.AAC.6